jgi:hypothetical protein
MAMRGRLLPAGPARSLSSEFLNRWTVVHESDPIFNQILSALPLP